MDKSTALAKGLSVKFYALDFEPAQDKNEKNDKKKGTKIANKVVYKG
jgi:hypothetical protein